MSSPETPLLRIRVFGQMRAQDALGRSVLPRARKTRALLAILALAAPEPVLRSQITALLWSQREKEQARASLRQAVHELQDTLGSLASRMIVAERNHVGLHRAGLWVDARAAGPLGHEEGGLLDLFRAPLLEDLAGLDPAFDRWVQEERLRLLRVARTLGEGMLAGALDAAERIAAAERLLLVDRAHEGAWTALIRVHAERGDRTAALACFERCRAALAETTHLVPSAAIQTLVAELRATAPAPVPNSAAGTVSASAGAPEVASPGAPRGPLSPARPNAVRLGIMPFRAPEGDVDPKLTQGLTEEVVGALARFRGLSCIPISSIAVLPTDLTRDAPLWEQLGLDYALEGSVQRSGDRVRVRARLIDVWAAGEVVWADRFGGAIGDMFDLQDEVAAAIVALLRQGERLGARRIRATTAHERLLQSIPAIYRLERNGFFTAGGLLDSAVAEDPGNAPAHAWYAYWHLFLVGQGWANDLRAATMRAAELAGRAVTLDPGDARALTLAGHVRAFLAREPEEACTLHQRAVALNPNLALARCFFGLAQCYRGRPEDGLPLIEQSIRLSPYDPHMFFFEMSLSMPHLLRGEYEKAAEAGRRAIELNPGFSSSYKGHLCALGHLGREEEAAKVRAALLRLEPGFSVAEAVDRSPLVRREDRARYAEGLRRAGLLD
ncbi:MAG: hypothetical protein J0H19_08570 [Rhodospirillales bacterium]|nr:hypothetical protein [Rhodospirillales bacterium]